VNCLKAQSKKHANGSTFLFHLNAMTNVYQKLNSARQAFHQAKLSKTGCNKFAGYTYFELSDFVTVALKVFQENGLCSVITFGKELATMRIVNTDKPDEYVEITSPMSTANLKGCHEVQQLGAVQSYLRRYLWVAALEIIEHDGIDSSEPVNTPDVKAILKGISASMSLEVLKTNYEAAMQMLDASHHQSIKDAANARKTALKQKETQ
jgi:hypothetical protein